MPADSRVAQRYLKAMLAGIGAILVALVAAPAAAVDEAAPAVPEVVLDGDPVTRTPAPPAPAADDAPDPALLRLQPATARLFAALTGGAADEEIERLVAAVARELDMDCPRVKEYQVYRASERSRTLKMKCVERPLYAVTVGISGEGFVAGGDGTIGPMRLDDGPIKAMMGVRVEEYIASTRAAQVREAEGEAPPPPAGERSARVWLARAAAAAAVALAIWLAALAVRERRRQRRSLSRWRGLDSDMKDQMIAESEEVYPNLYRHPEGVYIARGRRGKRRLFSSLVFGYLYSSRGIKLFEIR
jgi:hypothetical protein